MRLSWGVAKGVGSQQWNEGAPTWGALLPPQLPGQGGALSPATKPLLIIPVRDELKVKGAEAEPFP